MELFAFSTCGLFYLFVKKGVSFGKKFASKVSTIYYV